MARHPRGFDTGAAFAHLARRDRKLGAWMKRLGVTYLRTGLSWADSFRPNALDWFDRQMEALQDFDVTVTYCFTPEHEGLAPRERDAEVARRPVVELLRRDLVHARARVARDLRAAVAQSGLEVLRHGSTPPS